jgi:two-component system, cell cycle response regulator DivK
VITASGGLEALSLAHAHLPDVVFMDLKMNDLDGLEATRRLAANAATAVIPVIAVTASALGDVRQTARAAGCVDYLSKPIRVPLLFGLLQKHLGVRFVSAATHRASPDERLTDRDRRAQIAARLRDAVALGDVTEIQALARTLTAGDTAEAAVGERINRLAMNFDFEGLGQLADALAG